MMEVSDTQEPPATPRHEQEEDEARARSEEALDYVEQLLEAYFMQVLRNLQGSAAVKPSSLGFKWSSCWRRISCRCGAGFRGSSCCRDMAAKGAHMLSSVSWRYMSCPGSWQMVDHLSYPS